jgi:hypothetical protein
MPTWAVIYLILFLVLSLVGDGLGLSDFTECWRWLCDLAAKLVFALLFVGYWSASVRDWVGVAGVGLFVLAVGWEVYSGTVEVRGIWRDPELSKAERIVWLLVPPLLAWPLYVMAGIAAFTVAAYT